MHSRWNNFWHLIIYAATKQKSVANTQMNILFPNFVEIKS